MIYTISRRISNLEDVEVLAKKKVEKIIKINILRSEILLIYFSSNIDKPLIFIINLKNYRR